MFGWSWVPSDEEILKYRKMWNPFSHGPVLQQSVDIIPQGQWSIRPFIFSQIGEHSFGNRFSLVTDRKDGPVHLYSVQHPFVNYTYGLTNHLEFVIGTSVNTFWAKDSESFNKGQGGPWKVNTGLGDTSAMIKYRPVVQSRCRPGDGSLGPSRLLAGLLHSADFRPPSLGASGSPKASRVGRSFSRSVLAAAFSIHMSCLEVMQARTRIRLISLIPGLSLSISSMINTDSATT